MVCCELCSISWTLSPLAIRWFLNNYTVDLDGKIKIGIENKTVYLDASNSSKNY